MISIQASKRLWAQSQFVFVFVLCETKKFSCFFGIIFHNVLSRDSMKFQTSFRTTTHKDLNRFFFAITAIIFKFSLLLTGFHFFFKNRCHPIFFSPSTFQFEALTNTSIFSLQMILRGFLLSKRIFSEGSQMTSQWRSFQYFMLIFRKFLSNMYFHDNKKCRSNISYIK